MKYNNIDFGLLSDYVVVVMEEFYQKQYINKNIAALEKLLKCAYKISSRGDGLAQFYYYNCHFSCRLFIDEGFRVSLLDDCHHVTVFIDNFNEISIEIV